MNACFVSNLLIGGQIAHCQNHDVTSFGGILAQLELDISRDELRRVETVRLEIRRLGPCMKAFPFASNTVALWAR
jgi:hypothetical protein